MHRDLWPALVRLADRLDRDRLGWLTEVHTPSGAHRLEVTPFPDWVPIDVEAAAGDLPPERALARFPAAVCDLVGAS